jgi:cell division protein FtsB
MKKQQSNQERDECRVRIEKLEILLDKSSEEKDIMREQILKLTEQVSALKVKVEFLEKENKELSEKKNRS